MAQSRRNLEREATRLARLDASRIARGAARAPTRAGRLPGRRCASRWGQSIGHLRSRARRPDGRPRDPTAHRNRPRADLRVSIYPGATPMLHDAAHARIIERILRRAAHRRWRADPRGARPGTGSGIDRRPTFEAGHDRPHRGRDPHSRLGGDRSADLREARTGTRRCSSWSTGRGCAVPPAHSAPSAPGIGAGGVGRGTFPASPELARRALEEGDEWPGDGILWMAGGAD